MQTINLVFKQQLEEAIKMARQIEEICQRNLEGAKEKNGETKQNFSNQAH
jgi:hypothetical protein